MSDTVFRFKIELRLNEVFSSLYQNRKLQYATHVCIHHKCKCIFLPLDLLLSKILNMYFWPESFFSSSILSLVECDELFLFILVLRPSQAFITRCFIFINLSICPTHFATNSLYPHALWPLSFSASFSFVCVCVFSGFRFILFRFVCVCERVCLHCGQFADNSNSFQRCWHHYSWFLTFYKQQSRRHSSQVANRKWTFRDNKLSLKHGMHAKPFWIEEWAQLI